MMFMVTQRSDYKMVGAKVSKVHKATTAAAAEVDN